MSNPHRDEDGQPIPNSVPPTPFELASLAATFLAAGKTQDVAFQLAREVFERAEAEVMKFDPLAERLADQNLASMPDPVRDLEDECRSYLRYFGICQPEDSDFPLSFEAFQESVLPQKLIEDRRKFFRSQVKGAECPDGLIPDLYLWLLLFAKVAKLRGWDDPAKIKSEAKKFHARRVSKEYKLRPRRTNVEKSS